jgi:hypothetical protein
MHEISGAGAFFYPHPLPPLPQAGEGETTAGRTAMRPYTPRTAWKKGWG